MKHWKFIIIMVPLLWACQQDVRPPDVAEPTSAPDVVIPPLDAEILPVAEPPKCETTKSGLVACPDPTLLLEWAARHVKEPLESTLAADLDPPDPVKIRDGKELYDDLLENVAWRSRSHLDLWLHTPTLSTAEIEKYRKDPDLWADVVKFRSASSRDAIRMVRKAIHKKDARRLHAMLFRNGVFFVENPTVAAYAVRYVGLQALFDAPELELVRGGQIYKLTRSKNRYLHVDPVMDDVRARLHVFDRVGPPGTLEELTTYGLQEFRRTLGLSHIEVGDETPTGRAVTVVFFDETRLAGHLVWTDDGPQLAVLGAVDTVEALRIKNTHARQTVCDLLLVADEMVHERLPFDEPKVEYGQQDGYLRRYFIHAYNMGRSSYHFNGVKYQVFDRKGRPMPPQLCIDFVNDAVQRMHGAWWGKRGERSRPSNVPFEMTEYMPYRTVRSLLQLARTSPHVAQIDDIPRAERVTYQNSDAFRMNVWVKRASMRQGDIVVIYGPRDDGLDHYHSFYIRETDPMYGMPVVISANPGFARIQAWHEVMRESPLRSIQHIVRWNPDWLRAPLAVDAAARVTQKAFTLTQGPE